jgi:predicted anti-sigma-YlaC factor YlaD
MSRDDATRPPVTACGQVREALSATYDGEVAPLASQAVDRHLAICPTCHRFQADLGPDARRLRLTGAAVPDLTDTIVTAVVEERLLAPDRRHHELRLLVALAGVVQLAIAVPALFGLVAGEQHLLREAGALQLAVGVGFLFAAWQPRRAVGVLPVAVVVVVATALGAAYDIATGAATVVGELSHLAEVVGLLALWALSRRGDRLVGGGPAARTGGRGVRLRPAGSPSPAGAS